MSHDLASRDGRYQMFCVGDRDSAWHRLGQRTPNAVTWAEAVKLADLDWNVTKKQLYGRNPLGVVVPVPVYATFREDDGKFLGSVGEDYHIIQNREQFNFVDALLGAANGAHYESAGALGSGSRVWCLARIPEADYQIDGGDKHEMYVLAANSHDSSMSYTVKLTDTRVVCQNTLYVAMNEKSNSFRVRHTSGAESRMRAGIEMLSAVRASALSLKAKMEKLADRRLTRESVSHILDRLFPAPKDANASTARYANTLRTVLDLYEKNDANAFPSVKGTAYNLFNSITEYADHFRTSRGQGSQPAQVAMARAESSMFGSGSQLKTQALTVILEEIDQDTIDAGIGYLDQQ